MILLAVALSAIGLVLLPVQVRVTHALKYQRCLRNIAALEIDLGIVPAPLTRSGHISAAAAAKRWNYSSSQAAQMYAQGVTQAITSGQWSRGAYSLFEKQTFRDFDPITRKYVTRKR